MHHARTNLRQHKNPIRACLKQPTKINNYTINNYKEFFDRVYDCSGNIRYMSLACAHTIALLQICLFVGQRQVHQKTPSFQRHRRFQMTIITVKAVHQRQLYTCLYNKLKYHRIAKLSREFCSSGDNYAFFAFCRPVANAGRR